MTDWQRSHLTAMHILCTVKTGRFFADTPVNSPRGLRPSYKNRCDGRNSVGGAQAANVHGHCVTSVTFKNQESHEVVRREGATPTNSNRRRLLVWELRPRGEGSSIPAHPAWGRQIFEPGGHDADAQPSESADVRCKTAQSSRSRHTACGQSSSMRMVWLVMAAMIGSTWV